MSTKSSAITYAKRSRRAFLFFSNEHKKTIQMATGLGKGRGGRKALDSKVAEAWKFLNREQRAKYHAMEKRDKARFEAEVARGLPVPESKASMRRNVASRSAQPKRPHGAFMLFSKDHRQAVFDEAAAAGEAVVLGQVAQRLGVMWAELSDEAKQPYLEKGRLVNEQYRAAKKAYDDTQKKTQLESARKADRPKKFRSAYLRFMSENRMRVKEASAVALDGPGLSRALAAEWKALSEEEKRPFEEEAAVDQARFRAEMQAYRLRNHLRDGGASKKAPVARIRSKKVKKHTKAVAA